MSNFISWSFSFFQYGWCHSYVHLSMQCNFNKIGKYFAAISFNEWWNQYFSNSLIIHIVISLPERPILVRWMSLETQWKTSWKQHVFRNDFKPVCKIFLNLHIHNARRKHWHPKIHLITQSSYIKLSLFAINVECDIAVIKVTRTESCILLYNIERMTITATLLHLLSDASRRLKSKFAFFSSTNRRIPHTLFQKFKPAICFYIAGRLGHTLSVFLKSFGRPKSVFCHLQRVCFELTNNKTEKRCIKCKNNFTH